MVFKRIYAGNLICYVSVSCSPEICLGFLFPTFIENFQYNAQFSKLRYLLFSYLAPPIISWLSIFTPPSKTIWNWAAFDIISANSEVLWTSLELIQLDHSLPSLQNGPRPPNSLNCVKHLGGTLLWRRISCTILWTESLNLSSWGNSKGWIKSGAFELLQTGSKAPCSLMEYWVL